VKFNNAGGQKMLEKKPTNIFLHVHARHWSVWIKKIQSPTTLVSSRRSSTESAHSVVARAEMAGSGHGERPGELTLRQDLPPPDGYPHIQFQRHLPKRGPAGWMLFSLLGAITVYGVYTTKKGIDVRW
jgi:hypothetical protein